MIKATSTPPKDQSPFRYKATTNIASKIEEKSSDVHAVNQIQRENQCTPTSQMSSNQNANSINTPQSSQISHYRSDNCISYHSQKLNYANYNRKNYKRQNSSKHKTVPPNQHSTNTSEPDQQEQIRSKLKLLKSKSTLSNVKLFLEQISSHQTTHTHSTLQSDNISSSNLQCLNISVNLALKEEQQMEIVQNQKEEQISFNNYKKQIENKSLSHANTETSSSQLSKRVIRKWKKKNKNLILKLKTRQTNDFNSMLLISSKIDRSFSNRRETSQSIELHLETLNILALYVQEFKHFYQEVQCWEELIFLTYKKYYIERLKVQYFLQKIKKSKKIDTFLTSNPFILNFCQISNEEISDFQNTGECLMLQQKIMEQNLDIKNSLQKLYNHIIEKSGKNINLYECDDFSEDIISLMKEQKILLSEISDSTFETSKRIQSIIRCGLCVAFLDGFEINLEEIFQNEDQKAFINKYGLLLDSVCYQ